MQSAVLHDLILGRDFIVVVPFRYTLTPRILQSIAIRVWKCVYWCTRASSDNYLSVELVSSGRNEQAAGNLAAEFDVCKWLGEEGRKKQALIKSRTSLIKDYTLKLGLFTHRGDKSLLQRSNGKFSSHKEALKDADLSFLGESLVCINDLRWRDFTREPV